MFISYLNEMKSWIIFFVLAIGFVDGLIWLDMGIGVEISALLYMNVLLLILFAVFLVWRFSREMKYTKELIILVEDQAANEQESLPRPRFFRERQVDLALHKTIQSLAQELADVKNNNMMENEYTAAWVHEVKAPLTAMKLVIDANRHDPLIRKIESEWLRVHLLIDQQLSISRLPSLESDYVLERTGIQRLVTQEIRELASWCLEKNIAVEFEGRDGEVVTDTKWCRFIIRQFLTNAVKYSPVGGTIAISMTVKQNDQMQLVIADEGPGIKPHDLPRIFDKGFTGGTGRIHNAATGLGLHLANTVADKIGVALTASSEEGVGTTMHITFSNENAFDKTLR